jgi:hypothetical protein
MTVCSQCGALKRDVNHWWFGWTERLGQRICIVPWNFDSALVHEPHVEKLCGQSCVVKFVQQSMDQIQSVAA